MKQMIAQSEYMKPARLLQSVCIFFTNTNVFSTEGKPSVGSVGKTHNSNKSSSSN